VVVKACVARWAGVGWGGLGWRTGSWGGAQVAAREAHLAGRRCSAASGGREPGWAAAGPPGKGCGRQRQRAVAVVTSAGSSPAAPGGRVCKCRPGRPRCPPTRRACRAAAGWAISGCVAAASLWPCCRWQRGAGSGRHRLGRGRACVRGWLLGWGGVGWGVGGGVGWGCSAQGPVAGLEHPPDQDDLLRQHAEVPGSRAAAQCTWQGVRGGERGAGC
jgi:hypothetical protein